MSTMLHPRGGHQRRAPGARLLLVIGLMAVVLQGCDNIAEELIALFGAAAPRVLRGNQQVVGTLVAHDNNISIPAGTVQIGGEIRGQLPPQASHSPGASVAATAPLPSTLRLVIQQKSASGQVLGTLTFDLAVQGTGEIRTQSFASPFLFVGIGVQLEVSLLPVDADLPASTINLRMRYRKT